MLIGKGPASSLTVASPSASRARIARRVGSESAAKVLLSWSTATVLGGDVAKEVAKLREHVDGVILVAGSGQLVNALIEHDLVDEFRLMVFPVVLGSGKRLFGDTSAAKPLRLVESKPAAECLILRFEPVRTERAGSGSA